MDFHITITVGQLLKIFFDDKGLERNNTVVMPLVHRLNSYKINETPVIFLAWPTNSRVGLISLLNIHLIKPV